MWAQDKHTREWQLVPVAEASLVLEEHVTATLHDDVDVTEADVGVTNAVAIGEPFATLVPSGRKNGGGSVPCDVRAADGANGSFVDENGMQYHTIQPATDTFQGICIKYRITATELRRANNMLGTNLQLSPKRLLIPRRSLNGIADVGRQKRRTNCIFYVVHLGYRIVAREKQSAETESFRGSLLFGIGRLGLE